MRSAGPSTDLELAELVGSVQQAYGDVCFACSTSNPAGLHLEPVGVAGNWVRARFSPGPAHVGAPPSAHGGVVATAIDEIMVWAGIVFERVMTVTATLDLRFRGIIETGAEVIACGRVDDRSGRRIRMSARLELDGKTAAEGTGLYVVSQPLDELLQSRPGSG